MSMLRILAALDLICLSLSVGRLINRVVVFTIIPRTPASVLELSLISQN